VLRLFYGRNSDVTIEPVAVGRASGTISMMVNPDNPTVSTASHEIVSAARDAPGWEAQRWTRTIRVPVTTLDSLIARHGMPAFIKIDVEGFELEVLAGLSHLIAWSAALHSVLGISTQRLVRVRRLCTLVGLAAWTSLPG